MCAFLPAAVGNSLPVRHCCYAFRCGVCNSCHGTWCYRAEFRGKDLSATTINDVHGRKVSHLFENTAHYALRPHTVGALSVDGRRLSVCLFLAWPSVDNGAAQQGENWQEESQIWHHLEVKRSNACRARGFFFVAAQLVSFTGTLTYDCCIMNSKLKSLGGCSSHHLLGAGAYCVGPKWRRPHSLFVRLFRNESCGENV